MTVRCSSTTLEGKTVLHVLLTLAEGGAEDGVLKIADAPREFGAQALIASAGGSSARSLGRISSE